MCIVSHNVLLCQKRIHLYETSVKGHSYLRDGVMFLREPNKLCLFPFLGAKVISESTLSPIAGVRQVISLVAESIMVCFDKVFSSLSSLVYKRAMQALYTCAKKNPPIGGGCYEEGAVG